LGRGVRHDAVGANRYQRQRRHGKCAEDARNQPLLLQLRFIYDPSIGDGHYAVDLLLWIHSVDVDGHGKRVRPIAHFRHNAPVIQALPNGLLDGADRLAGWAGEETRSADAHIYVSAVPCTQSRILCPSAVESALTHPEEC
jgi:hypothetical protein